MCMDLCFRQMVCKHINLGGRGLDRFRQEVLEFMGCAVAMVVMVVKGFGVMLMVIVRVMMVKAFRVVGFERPMVDEVLVCVDFMLLWFRQEVWKHVNLGGRAWDKLRLLLVWLVGEEHDH